MGLTVEHDRPHDELHLVFRRDKLLISEEWCAKNATIALGADGEPLEITIHRYYTNTFWDFNEEFVKKYKLEEYLEDLRLVWQEFFAPPSYGVKSIHYEGPDGEEIIVRA